ncbi:hypothetical protein LJR143_000060 [Pseudoxanthomonas sp. LjRoot143]|uniref:hypothetical protein n=1 Tax=Pseudoxanthomonas sp. LjRoot143 TaxID=3342266 RepID=UPI003ED07DDF
MSAESRSRAVAAVIVLVIHVSVAWVLLRTPARHADGSDDRSVLRVRWIELAQPAPQPSLPPARATTSPPDNRPSPPSERVPPSQVAREPSPETTVSPRASDYLAQGAAWAAQTATAVDFQPGLTASRTPALPGGANGGRFRMREPTSPKRTVEKRIGLLFGGPHYTTDPCPRMHENVYGLLPDASDEGRRRLAWELREYRERCRP